MLYVFPLFFQRLIELLQDIPPIDYSQLGSMGLWLFVIINLLKNFWPDIKSFIARKQKNDVLVVEAEQSLIASLLKTITDNQTLFQDLYKNEKTASRARHDSAMSQMALLTGNFASRLESIENKVNGLEDIERDLKKIAESLSSKWE
jgi:hypothetical protein